MHGTTRCKSGLAKVLHNHSDAREPVQYRERAGTDMETGRPCRMVTPEILERLREYEKGKRPTRIESGDPTFFDPRTGEPIVWHVRNQRGDIELFDLMGFHPNSGEELVPVTREVAALWKERSQRQPPKRIDEAKHELFDPLTGEARVWYWRTIRESMNSTTTRATIRARESR